MGLQKRINKLLIKWAIGNKYVYQVEAEEAVKRWYIDDEKSSWLTWFLKEGVNEMKKEVKKKLNEE